MAGHSSFPSLSFSTSSTLQDASCQHPLSSPHSRTPASCDSTVFLQCPSKVHIVPSLQSRRVERDNAWIEMQDMEEGRDREPQNREGHDDWRDIPLIPIHIAPPRRTSFEAPAPALNYDSRYNASYSVPSQHSSPLPSAPPSPTVMTRMSVAWRYFIGVLCTLYTFGICHLYFEKFRMKPEERNSISIRTSSVVGVDPTHAQWLKVVRRMCGIWRLARVGCGLLLPLSVALLQIEGVVTTVFAKTCAISTAIFAGTGVLSSAMYLFCRKQLSGGENREKWKEGYRAGFGGPDGVENGGVLDLFGVAANDTPLGGALYERTLRSSTPQQGDTVMRCQRSLHRMD
ncbi:hypothetical protein D9613_012518 [Agrocybe pediades]|uniref:Uncharacterized protein n=1 Tax=Agrocybe pediades TaxID=84607 RepID=A0A8H4QRQ4_9AGAR|nr:hypothetical protein D9613_012518 [Agrocybe pediades]